MAKLTPEQAQEKHARRLKGATEDMRRGVEAVTEAPTAKAAKSIDKMRINYNAAIDSGKMKRRLESVTLDEWKTKMINKGIGRVAAGIDEAKEKTTKFYGELFPYQDRLQADVKKLPDVTLEDAITRMTTWVRGMAKFERKG